MNQILSIFEFFLGHFLLFLARFGYFWGCQSIRSHFLMQIASGNTSWDLIEPILWPFWVDEDVPGHPFSRFLNNFTVFPYKYLFFKSIWEKNPTSHTDFVSLSLLKYSYNPILTLFYNFFSDQALLLLYLFIFLIKHQELLIHESILDNLNLS